MKPDERLLLLELARLPRPRAEFATDVGVRLGLHVKRALYLLEKWADKRWWDCGVSLRTGWLTDAGQRAAADVGALP